MLTAAAIITGTSASSDGICPSGDTLKTWGQNRNHDYTHNPIHVCQYVMVGDCLPCTPKTGQLTKLFFRP